MIWTDQKSAINRVKMKGRLLNSFSSENLDLKAYNDKMIWSIYVENDP
jgi:hypothetical protein